MTASPWDQRIARATELGKTYSASAELLRFYEGVARLQKGLYEQMAEARLEEWFERLRTLARETGPAALAEPAEQAVWDESRRDEFFVRAILQAAWEFRAVQSRKAVELVRNTCPFCGEKPVAAVRRGEGDGGKRFLLCSLCATEWEFRRVLCANCGEEDKDKLPVYVSEEFPHVALEACDTCRTYLKSIDLTRNGLAVPVVDELATVTLDLWAAEKGYRKLQVNLLGL